MKALATVAFFITLATSAHATDYRYLICADLDSMPGAISHFIGWLNLRNYDRTTTEIDFKQGLLDEMALERTCKGRPELPLHLAVLETFAVFENEGAIGSLRSTFNAAELNQ